MRPAAVIALVLSTFLVLASHAMGQAGQFSSGGFASGGQIPEEYACGIDPQVAGAGTSPPLAWSPGPPATQRWAMGMIDQSAGGFVHWFWWDVSLATNNLVADANIAAVGGREGINDFGEIDYGGPCPPLDPCLSHTYRFTLYAQNQVLNLPSGSSYEAFISALMNGAIAEERTFTGLYPQCGVAPPPPPPPPVQPAITCGGPTVLAVGAGGTFTAGGTAASSATWSATGPVNWAGHPDSIVGPTFTASWPTAGTFLVTASVGAAGDASCSVRVRAPSTTSSGAMGDDIADADQDGIEDESDNCPSVANHEQANSDVDGEGDACDLDNDNDGIKDQGGVEACDSGFTVGCRDNCRLVPNPTQDDQNDNHVGDACEASAPGAPPPDAILDADNDGILNVDDNCGAKPNADQTNRDGDAQGDACDDDLDGDGVQEYPLDGFGDNCPVRPNFEQRDTDHDGIGDLCDPVQNVPIAAVDDPQTTGRPAGFEPKGDTPDLWTMIAWGTGAGLLVGLVAGIIVFVRSRQG